MRSLIRSLVVAAMAAAILGVVSMPPPPAVGTTVAKVAPRRVTPYRVGRAIGPDTNIRSASGYAAWMIDEFLAAQTPLPPLGTAFLVAERKSGVNARVLLAIAVLESRYGTSAIARSKHNLFGYHAYDRDPFRYAAAYRSYQASIAAVAAALKADYLSPTGRFWSGFPTLQGVNLAYASDVRWADKVAALANAIDASIVTLRERGIAFASPRVTSRVVTQAGFTVSVGWHGNVGATLPSGLTFSARWTPVALAENSPAAPAAPPAPAWTPVAARRTAGRGAGNVTLSIKAPSQPGLWRLDLDPRDTGGGSLPVSDHPTIASIVVRVGAPAEASMTLGVARNGGALIATVTAAGTQQIGSASGGPSSAANAGASSTVLEAWWLPLDPSQPTTQLARLALTAGVRSGHSATTSFGAPAGPGIVVVRLGGYVAPGVHAVPSVTLVTRKANGALILQPIQVSDPRTAALLATTTPSKATNPHPAGLIVASGAAPGSAAITLSSAAADVTGPTVGDVSSSAPQVLLRTVNAIGGQPAGPVDDLLSVTASAGATSAAGSTASVTQLPPGICLAIAALVPDGASSADPRTIVATWLPVVAPAADASPN